MSFTVRFLRNSSAHYTFAASTFLSPTHAYDFDDDDPPRLSSITKTWTIQGTLYGANEAAVITAWDSLKTAIETPDTYPDGIELRRGNSTVESITTAGGYAEWKVTELSSPRHEGQWRERITFTMRVSAKRTFANTGNLASVSKITQTETWAYDDAGLLTQTLEGEIEVIAGYEATEVAREVGVLDLPGTDFAYDTNGPEGVDVVKLDRGNRKAKFTSRVREAGEALPSNVAAGFTVARSETTSNGKITTTITVSARGVGAESAVLAQAPVGGVVTKEFRYDRWQRTASAVYVTEDSTSPDASRILRLHRFTSRGGGRKIAWTKRTGGRLPIKHVGPFEPVEINEQLVVSYLGKPSDADAFKFPAALAGLDEDTNALEVDGPTRVRIGKDASGDEWEMGLRRRYMAPSFEVAFELVAKSAIGADSASETDARGELARKNLDSQGG